MVPLYDGSRIFKRELEIMKVLLEKEEAEKLFHNALCGVYGSGYWGGYGLSFEYDRDQYRLISEGIKAGGKRPCHEDVLLGMLKAGGELSVKDHECDGSYDKTITLKDIHEKIGSADVQRILAVTNGTGDVVDDDCVLQNLFFGEVIFG